MVEKQSLVREEDPTLTPTPMFILRPTKHNLPFDSDNLINLRSSASSANEPRQAHPSAAKEREKSRHEKAKEFETPQLPQEQAKDVERWYDDAGDKPTGLIDADLIHAAYAKETDIDDEKNCNESASPGEDHVHGFHHQALHGYGDMKAPTTAITAALMQHKLAILAGIGPGNNVAEFCGGKAKTTTVAIRRRLRRSPSRSRRRSPSRPTRTSTR